MALLESFIYTQDAMRDYLNVLDDDGQVAIVGDAPGGNTFMLTRLFVTAMTELERQGMSQGEAGRHIAITFDQRPGPYQWSMVVRKRAIDPSESERLNDIATEHKVMPIAIPGKPSAAYMISPLLVQVNLVAQGTLDLAALVADQHKQGFDMSPCPDNRPFVLDLSTSPWTAFTTSPSLTILLGLAIGSTLFFAVLALGISGRRRASPAWIGYFLALGVGFMLVEIPLIQKLILPLGYPTLSLTVILFSLLLGGGGGALYSQRLDGPTLSRYGAKCALGVAIIAGILILVSGPLGNFLLQISLAARCGVVAAMILPLGFLLGTPFPTGIRLLTARDEAAAESVPLLWALNGTASVVGSIFAAVGAKMGGFSFVLAVGAVIYLLAGTFLARKS
jgi:hypothetical protein